ncbi:hypothetical protein MASR1M31_21710 [Porphyromonadaceae bacterium]
MSALQVSAQSIMKTILVAINDVNVMVNGKMAGASGEDFSLENGTLVPNSIIYNGTTYLPIRKVAEMLGKEVTWDGTTKRVGIVNSSITEPIESAEIKETSVKSSVINIDDRWTAECKLVELPITINAYNGISLTINSVTAKTTGILMNITMKNNSSVSDKGDPMVSTWDFFDGTRTLDYISADRIFYDVDYLRSGQEITGNIGFKGMTSGTNTLILYGGLWQYIDREEFKVIIHLN